MSYDILIAGVGGQGTVLASRIIALSAIDSGYFARTAETIGMAQRGGCVVSHVRIDSKNKSPIIPEGKADLIIGFEPSEALRNIEKLSKDGKCIINAHEVKPITASLGSSEYDFKQIIEFFSKNNIDVDFVEAYDLTNGIGAVKALNIFLIGYVSGKGLLPIQKEDIVRTITKIVPDKYQELNMKAFELGFIEANKKI
jgi:indolepyruvate ferredoxin oxidoreductase beta subunit